MREPEKKSESLEVRLSHSAKRAFMERCRERGSSASEELRAFIDRYLAETVAQPPRKVSVMPFILKPAAVAAVAAPLVAWLSFGASPAVAQPDLRAIFQRIDANGDGKITPDEFTRHRDDHVMFVNRAEAPAPAPGAPGAVPFAIPLAGAAPAPVGMHHAPREMMIAEHARQDRDGNGGVTFEEFAAHHREMIRAGFNALDRNRDGGVDKAEFDTAMTAMPHRGHHPDFAALDRDGSGKVEWEEFAPR